MLIRTEGIVLRTQRYGEADLMVTYLTLSNGIIRAFARSPRKIRSRFGSSLEPLTHARISLWGREHSTPRVTQSDIINPFHQLRENLMDFINISKLIEILVFLIPQGIPNKRLFSFFLNIMNLLQSLIIKNSELRTENKDAMYLIFQVRLLAILGYEPNLKGCGKCGAKSLDFYPSSGTVLCSRCAIIPATEKEASIKLTKSVIKFYSHSIGWPISILSRLNPPPEIISNLSSLLQRHINCVLGRKLLSSDFPVTLGSLPHFSNSWEKS